MTSWLTAWGEPTSRPSMPGMPSGSATGGAGGGHDDHDMSAMPGTMDKGDMTTLEGLTGTEFDRSFLTMMTAHHQGAIDMAKTERNEGLYPPAIELAESIETSQTAEIRTMKALLGTL